MKSIYWFVTLTLVGAGTGASSGYCAQTAAQKAARERNEQAGLEAAAGQLGEAVEQYHQSATDRARQLTQEAVARYGEIKTAYSSNAWEKLLKEYSKTFSAVYFDTDHHTWKEYSRKNPHAEDRLRQLKEEFQGVRNEIGFDPGTENPPFTFSENFGNTLSRFGTPFVPALVEVQFHWLKEDQESWIKRLQKNSAEDNEKLSSQLKSLRDQANALRIAAGFEPK